MAVNKKNLSEWHGTGFVTDRGTTPLPHMGGPKGVGAEGPKRLQPKKPKATTTTSRDGLKDKYGRKITRAEYERREAFRKKRSTMTAAQAEKATKVEMERRKKWRESAKKNLGSAVTTRTRNKDMATGTSSRYINARTKTKTKGTGSGTVSSAVAKGERARVKKKK